MVMKTRDIMKKGVSLYLRLFHAVDICPAFEQGDHTVCVPI